MKTTKNSSEPVNNPIEIKVSVKYDQPQFLFSELPSQYRNLMEFDIALVKEHFAKKNSANDAHIFLHEPYFEYDTSE